MRVTMVGGKNPLKGTRVWINKRHVFFSRFVPGPSCSAGAKQRSFGGLICFGFVGLRYIWRDLSGAFSCHIFPFRVMIFFHIYLGCVITSLAAVTLEGHI